MIDQTIVGYGGISLVFQKNAESGKTLTFIF